MNTLFLAILFFLLFSFAAKTSSSSSSATTDDPVFDINGDLLPIPKCQLPCPSKPEKDHEGNRLQPDKFTYYIVAAEGTESGHGVRPCPNKGQECPPLVVLDKENTKYATAFKSVETHSCKRSIEFVEKINKCTGQKVWTDLPNVIPIPDAKYLLGCEEVSTTSRTWFQFVKDERYEEAYRIVYFKNDDCFNVSHVPNYNKPFLALSKTLDPLVVQFMKGEPLNPVLKNISTEMPTVLSVA